MGEKHNWVGSTFGCCRGYKRFYKRSLLEGSDYLKDDCLIIKCRVGVVKTNTEGPKTYNIAEPPSNIGQHFGKLLESGKLTDVSFKVDEEVFAAHKVVLAARSPVFKAQLFGPLKDKNTDFIIVEDIEAPAFKVLLLSLYEGFSSAARFVPPSKSVNRCITVKMNGEYALIFVFDAYGWEISFKL